MSLGHSNHRRAAGSRIAVAIALLCAPLTAFAYPPHADVPLDPVQFSIDLLSPSIGPTISPADILKKPGPFPLALSFGLGITPLDDLDGISADEGELLPMDEFVFLFSVGRGTVGGAAPDPGLVSLNRPFNVFDQAMRNQAVGDVYMTTHAFNAGGIILSAGPRGPAVANNTLVINQGDAGGVDMDLKNEKAPIKFDTAFTKDGVDALSGASSSSTGAALVAPFALGAPRGPGGPGGDPTDVGPVFFTLRRGSPSLLELPAPVPSPANIYFDFDPFLPGNEQLFIGADALGLGNAPIQNDISGLTVLTGGPSFGPGTSMVLFTLAPGSPALGVNFSPADIFISTGGGTFQLFASAEQLGLSAATDSVSGFTILRTINVDQLVLDSAIQLVIPGDFDGDLALTDLDCEEVENCFSGSGIPFDDNGITTFGVDVGPGPVFTPAVMTIEEGDTVEWTWFDGPHNVVSGPLGVPDGAFNSGPPTDVAGTVFDVTFDSFFLNTFPKQAYPYFSAPDIAAGMSGAIFVQPHPCATFDIDFDGDVDCNDWREFRALYIQLNGGVCIPLTIEEFAAALVCQPLHPAHTCFADVNGDGVVDGRDVRPYVQHYLGGS